MTDTALLAGEVAEPALGSGGGGGDGVDDDGSGGWWEWSEGPADDEAPYRASRLRRAVAIATTAAVVAGSMTLLAVVAADPAAPQYPVGSVRLVTSTSAEGEGSAAVRFVVTNASGAAGRARCRVWLALPNRTSATATIRTPRLTSGRSVTELVALPGPQPSGGRPRASCATARA